MTVWVNVVEVLSAWVSSPPYRALIRCCPVARLDVWNDPTPLVSELLPRTDVPSLNVTVPVAVDGVTVAVKATTAPKVAGFGDALSAVAVDGFFGRAANTLNVESFPGN